VLLAFSLTTSGVAAAEEKRRSMADASRGYLLWFQIAVISSLVCILFGKALFQMALEWWRWPALSQGMLLPPLALFVAWIERRRLLGCPATGELRGTVVTAMGCSVFVVGKLASEFFLMRFSFVILIAGLIWTFWGLARLRVLAFPLLLLACMVPLPAVIYNSAAGPLQLFASDVASRIAQTAGVSVFRDGNVIQLAGISLGVAEACSGLSCLSALVVGGLLLGYLLCTRTLSRIVLVLAAVPLAIAVNVVRVAGTAVLADYNQAFAMGFYHAFSGWLVFMAGMLALYGMAGMIHRFMDSKEAA
jgi:exosortase